MNRTGVEPSEKAFQIFKMINDHEFLEPAGLHVYDGHIRHSDPEVRKKHCDSAFELVLQLKTQIENAGIPVKEIVAGGSPTFPIHAKREEVIASPGTTLLWDARYGSSFPDMQFLPAAVLLTRVISKPARNILCLDLGHKAVAPEMDFPRVLLLEMEAFKQIGQSEEHLVLSSPDDRDLPIGTVCYAIPMHVCPTVAKYPKAHTVIDGKITGEWKVAARDHQITI
jgi:D-serine deaminase-like pyridoxal phosphate-dependent protein